MITGQKLLHDALQWVHHTLLVVGVLASIAFIRVNFFNAELMLDTPKAPEPEFPDVHFAPKSTQKSKP